MIDEKKFDVILAAKSDLQQYDVKDVDIEKIYVQVSEEMKLDIERMPNKNEIVMRMIPVPDGCLPIGMKFLGIFKRGIQNFYTTELYYLNLRTYYVKNILGIKIKK